MKYLQGLNYVKPFLKKIKNPIKTITNPISGKTITNCHSKKDCATNLNILLNNYDMHPNHLVQL